MSGGVASGRLVERNAISLLLARVVAALVMTAVIAIAAHRLSVDDFGLVVSTLAAGFLVNTLVTFGTDTLITRSVAAAAPSMATGPSAGPVVVTSLRLQLGLAAVITGAALVAVLAGAPMVILIQASSLLPLAVVTIAGAVLRGAQRMVPLFVASMLTAVTTLGASIIGFAVSDGPLVPIVAIALGALVSAIWLARQAHRHVEDRSEPLPVGELLRSTAPFAGMVILAAVGAQGGLLLVEFLGDEPTGGYGAAIRMTEASRLLPAAVIGAVFPAMMTGLHRTRKYRRWLQLLGLYAIAATVVLMVTAGPINSLVFDSQPDGAVIIRILALTLGLTVMRLAFSFEAIAEGQERLVLISALVGTGILLVGGAALVGPAGAAGVAWAQVAGVAAAVAVLVIGRRSATSKSPRPPVATPISSGELRAGFGQIE